MESVRSNLQKNIAGPRTDGWSDSRFCNCSMGAVMTDWEEDVIRTQE